MCLNFVSVSKTNWNKETSETRKTRRTNFNILGRGSERHT